MTIQYNQDGVIQNISKVYRNVAGAVYDVEEIFRNENGAIVNVFQDLDVIQSVAMRITSKTSNTSNLETPNLPALTIDNPTRRINFSVYNSQLSATGEVVFLDVNGVARSVKIPDGYKMVAYLYFYINGAGYNNSNNFTAFSSSFMPGGSYSYPYGKSNLIDSTVIASNSFDDNKSFDLYARAWTGSSNYGYVEFQYCQLVRISDGAVIKNYPITIVDTTTGWSTY